MSERGAMAGLEGLLFGVLILLGGLTLIVNAWSVVDSKMTLDSASREFVRAYTDQNNPVSARTEGEEAARVTLRTRSAFLGDARITLEEPNGFGPCSTVTVTISADVPAMKAPFIDRFTPVSVSSTISELTPAHREMENDSRYDPDVTECFGD